MAIPPLNPFFKFTCDSCGGSVVSVQDSDVIMPPPCPHCGPFAAMSIAKPPGSIECMKADPIRYMEYMNGKLRRALLK